MRQEVIIFSLRRRVTERTNLVLVALVGGIFCIFRLVVDLPPPRFLEVVLPFVLLLAHLAFSPIPWQWTGDDGPRAGVLRGFLQAVVFDAAWIALLLLLLFALVGPPGEVFPLRHPPPPMPGPPQGPVGPPGPPPGGGFRWPGALLGLGLINFAFAIAFGWVFAEKEATEARERETAERLKESQARALQNQLDPHVLYNALSSLSELVYEDPLAAEDVITRLADLYRMLTVHGKADRIPLGQERQLVEAYLAMEQMRLGERLSVEWDWPAYADELLAPPLFLQPLVENAIKHGISPSDQGGKLVISCAKAGDRVLLAVENTGAPLKDQRSTGVGLGNLEARLALWSEVSGTFTLAREGEWTVAKVQWTVGAKA